MNLPSRSMFPLEEDEEHPSFQFLSNDFHLSEASGDSFHDRSERVLNSRSVQSSRRSSVTIDRLRYSELQVHGRGIEQATILERLKKVGTAGSSIDGDDSGTKSIKQLVLISGSSGTGKTTLAMTLEKPALGLGGIFAIGKYDVRHQSEPYLGLVSAFEMIFLQLSDPVVSHNRRYEPDLFRKDVCDDIGNDIEILSYIAPSIVKFMGKNIIPATDSDQDSDEFGYGHGRPEAKAKLHFVIRQLFRILCKHRAPVVIALDDLQWADLASLELIEDFLSDRNNRNLMLLGIYRSEEVDDDSLLAKALMGMHSKTSQGLLEITELSLGSIDVEGVNGIITDLLSLDSSEATMELANICHRRTQGNVFFVISFLRMLNDKRLLTYNFGAMKWIWDISAIEHGTSATLNVVALTQRKMACLSKYHQKLLALAACLGFLFEKQKFSIAASGVNLGEKSDSNTDIVPEFLALAVNQGYLEGPLGDSHQYRWVHDSIHEAALSLIPENDIVKFQYDVGKGLLSDVGGKEFDRNLFVVVGLLNPYAMQVGGLNDMDKEILSSLNLAAAKRSMKSASFPSTASFAKIGISLLPKKHWESRPRLSLKLFTIACEAEAYLLNEEGMNFYGSELIKQESVSLFDKMRVYRAKLSFLGLGTANRAHEAVELCLEVLNQLGCTFPKTEIMKTIKLISALMKHKRDLPKRTADEVASLPVLRSRQLREIDGILNELTLFAYTAGNMMLSGLCTMKQTSITLKHGMHNDAYNGFCSLAPFFMVAFGDIRATEQVAQYSRFLKERAYGKKDVVRFCLMQASFSMPWKHPWTSMIKVLTDGFESGIREGELRNAYFCIAAALTVSFYSGTNLDKLQHDIQKTLQYSSDITPGMPLKDILILEHCITMLLDISCSNETPDHPLVSQYAESVKNEEFTTAVLYVYQGYIYYAQGYYVKGAALAQTTGILLDKLLSHFTNLPVLYHQAFCLYVSAQTCSNSLKRRKLKYLATKRHKILKEWAGQGCCNALHYVAILDAEQAILHRIKPAKVENLYQKAIVLAVRGGFLQDAAVSNERLAGFFLQQGDKSEACRRYEQSIRYFEDWGFKVKAERLQKESKDLLASWSATSSRSVQHALT